MDCKQTPNILWYIFQDTYLNKVFLLLTHKYIQGLEAVASEINSFRGFTAYLNSLQSTLVLSSLANFQLKQHETAAYGEQRHFLLQNFHHMFCIQVFLNQTSQLFHHDL